MRISHNIILRGQPTQINILRTQRIRPDECKHDELIQQFLIGRGWPFRTEPVHIEQNGCVEQQPRDSVSYAVFIFSLVQRLYNGIIVDIVPLILIVVLNIRQHVEVMLGKGFPAIMGESN